MITILLIEDNSDILENLKECLELEGYRVLVSNNGMQGVELAKEFIPNLIICDVLMNLMNGYEVLELILKNAETCCIPFIFSTSNSEKVDREAALKLGADNYIVKPFKFPLLLEMAKALIRVGNRLDKKSVMVESF